jgi:hypothetical protein
MAALMNHNLIDDYPIWVHPLVLGTGKRLFEEGLPTRTLRLVERDPSAPESSS